jgi:F-box and leucine-rich repeat protein GRR1
MVHELSHYFCPLQSSSSNSSSSNTSIINSSDTAKTTTIATTNTINGNSSSFQKGISNPLFPSTKVKRNDIFDLIATTPADSSSGGEVSPSSNSSASPRLEAYDDGISQYDFRIKDRSPIECLPPELIVHIFSFITEKEHQWHTLLVCKTWFSSIVDSLWFRPTINSAQTLDRLLTVLSTPLQNLSVDYPSLVRRINLTNIPDVIDDEKMLRLMACTKLERLTIAGCAGITDKSLVSLLKANEGILSVDMTGLEKITDKTLVMLGNNCNKLQGLYASNCKLLTDKSIRALATKCSNLKRLKLNGCSLVTDDAVRELIKRCSMLVELDLSGCVNVSDETASLAYSSLSQLREYRVAMNENVSDFCLALIPTSVSFDKLRIMDFSSCPLISDECIGKLVSLAPRLRNVGLAKCFQITDRSLSHLSKLGRNLHYIHLGHCNNITNTGITVLVKACTRIQYIDVACCSQIQDEAVMEIAQLPKLRRVGLVKCQNISDVGISAFTQRTGNEATLERIHLSYCSNISIEAITNLVNTCHRLMHLSLTGVPAFMREDLFQYCREPPPEFTQHQQQSFCVFSGAGVKQLRDHLNGLANLYNIESHRMNTELENHQGNNMGFFPNLEMPSNAFPQVQDRELAAQLYHHQQRLLEIQRQRQQQILLQQQQQQPQPIPVILQSQQPSQHNAPSGLNIFTENQGLLTPAHRFVNRMHETFAPRHAAEETSTARQLPPALRLQMLQDQQRQLTMQEQQRQLSYQNDGRSRRNFFVFDESMDLDDPLANMPVNFIRAVFNPIEFDQQHQQQYTFSNSDNLERVIDNGDNSATNF